MKIHIVQKGDTLWKIAKKYGVNFEELKKMNSQLSNPDMIMPGMKIKVPTTGGSVVKEAPISGKPEAKINLGAKKEMPKVQQPLAKEMPIKEAPIVEAPKKEAPIEMPKMEAPIMEAPIVEAPKAPKVEAPKMDLPKAEAPKKPYTPKMPKPVVPEIDINNYYMMNMANLSIPPQQPQQPLKPTPQLKSDIKPQPQLPLKPKNILPDVKPLPTDESPESFGTTMNTPTQGGQYQQMYPFQMPYSPVSPVMPGAAPFQGGYAPQAAPAFPHMHGGTPAHSMPYGMMPGVAGASMPQQFEDESSSSFMHHMGNMPNLPNMPMVAGAANQPLAPTMQDAQLPLQPTYTAPAMHDPCYPQFTGPIMQDPCYPGMMPQVAGAMMPPNYPHMPQVAGAMMPPNYPHMPQVAGAMMPPGYPCGPQVAGAMMPPNYPHMPQVAGAMDQANYPHMPQVAGAMDANYPHMPQVAGAMDANYPHMPQVAGAMDANYPHMPQVAGAMDANYPHMPQVAGAMDANYPHMPQVAGAMDQANYPHMPQVAGAMDAPMYKGAVAGAQDDCGCGGPQMMPGIPYGPGGYGAGMAPVYAPPYGQQFAQPPYMAQGFGPMGGFGMPRQQNESEENDD